ncbi:hypothetical protein CDL15_Pgr011579 [Punica granatum]|uniref:TIR domain-containing protein n=1 Tax=Punica granatum TaxID=22663 RepID=A0A218Y1V4_PUNGR|nr:hypothetical protein CDL15_Pgr011579 [Punica granatum]
MASNTNGGQNPQSDYQVFLSFRGKDTRQGFTDCLYHFLIDAGIRVFRDNEELRPGHKIKEILTAINKSLVCVPILSPNYANSKWCLLELAEMVKLKKDIMPIFYKVEANDVKLKTKLYRDQLSEYGKEYDADKVKWGRALEEVGAIFDKAQLEGTFKEVGRIKAWTLMDYPGYGEVSKEVVREILIKLQVKHKVVEGPLIGMDDHVDATRKLLHIGSADVRFVVIHGSGGVGKTTLAKVIFNQLCDSRDSFHHCCFLGNVRETAKRNGLVHLQNMLLREFNPRMREISDIDSGIKTIKDSVMNKKVLIILDDLDEHEQIENLAGDPTWFGLGSRIIVTTRNRSCILGRPGVLVYCMSVMSFGHALQLFSKHAFKMDSPPIECLQISKEVVAACGRLPLALEVMGSYLHHVDKDQWKSKIDVIASHNDVQKKLMISFEALDPRTKEIFLDIVCFFVDRETMNAKYMWEACDFQPEEGVERLKSMSLIKISEKSTFWMHDLIRDLGREIIIQENLKRPERRSRLWSTKQVKHVLLKEKGTSDTDAFCPSSSNDGFDSSLSTITAKQIKPLQSLRFLELHRVQLTGDFEYALQDLKWFSWSSHRSATREEEYLEVTNLVLQDIVVLNLSISNITDDWFWGPNKIKIGENLKVLDLSQCTELRRTPNFSKLQVLERLSLDSCGKLQEIDRSIGKLRLLKYLNIRDCQTLGGLPEEMGNLENLEELMVVHCGKDQRFSIQFPIGTLGSLSILKIESVNLFMLPPSTGALRKLKQLSIASTKVRELPETLGYLSLLTELDVSSSPVNKLPMSIGLLKDLRVMKMNSSWIRELPSSIGYLEKLEELHAADSFLEHIPEDIGRLSRLRILDLSHSNNYNSWGWPSSSRICGLPSTIYKATALQQLFLSNCDKIEELPNLPSSLTSLHVSSRSLWKLPNLSNLECLNNLKLTGNMDELVLNLPGRHPSSNANWIKNLPLLESFTFAFRSITHVQMDTSAFPRLKELRLYCPDLQIISQLPLSLSMLHLLGIRAGIRFPECLREMEGLKKLDLSHCRFVNELPQLGNVQHLRINWCTLPQSILDLSGFRMLQKFEIIDCKNLVAVRGVENMKFLNSITVFNCPSLREIYDLSKFSTLHFRLDGSLGWLEGPSCPKSYSAVGRGCYQLPEGMPETDPIEVEWKLYR